MFTHIPLNDNINAFRLLRVLPERRHDSIQIELWNDNLHETNAYRCLSYTWGDPVDSHLIEINGQPFAVGRNLLEFLQAAIQSAMFQPLWIDALCIDQGNDVEKADQVGRMGNIYERAVEVIVWLSGAVDLSPFIHWVHHGPLSKMPDEVLHSFTSFTQHPYWIRTWITQEILLASSISIWCEYGKIDWKVLGDALILLDTYDRQVHGRRRGLLGQETHSIYSPLLFVMEWRRRRDYYPNFTWALRGEGRKSLKADFWEILGWRWYSECSLVADHIFGLSGLTEEYARFTISYQESLSSVFWRAGEHFEGWKSTAFMTLLKNALQLSPDTLQYPPPECNILRIRLRLAPLELASRRELSPPPQACTEYAEVLCASCSIQFEPRSHQDILLCADWGGRGSRLQATFAHILLSPVAGTEEGYTVKVFPGPPLLPFDAPSHCVFRRTHGELVTSGSWSALTAAMSSTDTDCNWEMLLPATYVFACLEALELPAVDIKLWKSLIARVKFPAPDDLRRRWIGKAHGKCDDDIA